MDWTEKSCTLLQYFENYKECHLQHDMLTGIFIYLSFLTVNQTHESINISHRNQQFNHSDFPVIVQNQMLNTP